MPKHTPIAITARISRSRSSNRCVTKGCSVPSSSSRPSLFNFMGGIHGFLAKERQTDERGGRKRATRAAPDCALLRTPLRCLYHCGVAPRFRRQFFFGCLYCGGG